MDFNSKMNQKRRQKLPYPQSKTRWSNILKIRVSGEENIEKKDRHVSRESV